MKKIYSFLLLLVSAIVVSLTFYGCGDDDDDDNTSPATALYTEPYLVWGATQTTVKNWESRELYETGTDDSGYDYILYVGENDDVMGVQYSFSLKKLKFSIVGFNSAATAFKKEIISFLESKNYTFAGNDEEGDPWYISKDNKTAVCVYLDSGLEVYACFYMSAETASQSYSSLRASVPSFKQKKTSLKNVLSY